MSGDSENIFITGSQIPNANEKTTQSILDIIKNANTFQDVINKLEEDKLIWYFLRHLLKDQEVLDLINPKWKKEFTDFNKSIDSTVKGLKESTENKEFLVYPKSDNSLDIRFIADDPEQISVEISSVSRASPEGKAINISLGGDGIVTVTRKNGNERHYDFSNSNPRGMIIDWEAKDDQGNVIDCSMTVRVGPHGIEKVIDEPQFGGITDEKKVMELVKQNTEVFINGKTLYLAFTSIGQNVNNQQKAGETILPDGVEEKGISRSNSNLSVDENDSGVFTPASVESDTESISDGNKYENDDFENKVKVEEEDHEELEQKSKQSAKKSNEELEQENLQLKGINEELEQDNEKLEQGNTQLKKENKELKERNERIVAEGDDYILQLEKSVEQIKLQVKLLEIELAKKKDELHKVHEENEAEVTALVDKIGKLEEDLKDRDNTIRKLENEITRLTGEINRINKVNEELQSQLDESEQEKRHLKIENEKLKKDNQERTSALNGKGEELAESQSKLQQPNEKLQKQLKDLTDENENLKDDLEQERKKNQQPNVNVLNEMSGDGKGEEIQKLKDEIQGLEITLRSIKKQNELAQEDEVQRNKLKKQVKEKNREISKINEKLEEAKKEIESREGQSKQKIQELGKKLQIAQEELEEIRDELNQNNGLIDKLRDGTVSKKLFAKLQSERDKLNNDSTVKEKQLVAINTKLEQAHKEVKDTQEILETLQDKLRQQEEQKATQHEIRTETELPEDNKDMQTTMIQQNPIIKKLRQENTSLIKDKQTILIKLKQEVKENSGLKQRLKNLQEKNEQLQQKPAKKETRDGGGQTEGKFSRNVFDDKGKYVRTEFKGMPPPETDLSETRVNAYNTNKQKKDPSPGP